MAKEHELKEFPQEKTTKGKTQLKIVARFVFFWNSAHVKLGDHAFLDRNSKGLQHRAVSLT